MVRENSILLGYGVIGSTIEFESISPESYSGSPTILIGTKQLSVTLLNSVITLKLIIWVKKRKNVR
nr:MAG TPA: hypothetical protein [Caudoviricetes sp.]